MFVLFIMYFTVRNYNAGKYIKWHDFSRPPSLCDLYLNTLLACSVAFSSRFIPHSPHVAFSSNCILAFHVELYSRFIPCSSGIAFFSWCCVVLIFRSRRIAFYPYHNQPVLRSTRVSCCVSLPFDLGFVCGKFENFGTQLIQLQYFVYYPDETVK